LEVRQNNVVLIVEDNGRGFSLGKEANLDGRRLGLVSIRERATLMNGTIEIEASKGKGTTLFVRAPAQFAADDGDTKT
jgi:signal transduction histidine kinase